MKSGQDVWELCAELIIGHMVETEEDDDPVKAVHVKGLSYRQVFWPWPLFTSNPAVWNKQK